MYIRGTANCNSILSRHDLSELPPQMLLARQIRVQVGFEIEFFCRPRGTSTAGSLTSTYRVVRKYNFKS